MNDHVYQLETVKNEVTQLYVDIKVTQLRTGLVEILKPIDRHEDQLAFENQLGEILGGIGAVEKLYWYCDRPQLTQSGYVAMRRAYNLAHHPGWDG
ncbi:MAG: hypothetical protein WAO98_02635 [Alphaproteobacteria bacterium]